MNAHPDALHVSVNRMDQALERLDDLLTKAAMARAEAEAAEERKKQIKAIMEVKFRDDGMSMAEASSRAMASEPYKNASDAWTIANADYRKAEAKAEHRKLSLDVWRTVNASERAKMNMR